MKNIKGITLISLVITIAVLIILAGISINILVEDNIVNRAVEAKETMQVTQLKEEIDMAMLYLQMEKKQSESSEEISIYQLKDKIINQNLIKQEQINEQYIIQIGNSQVDLKDWFEGIVILPQDYEENFEYTGSVQEFIAPINETYKIECWGGTAGTLKGGYTSGEITLKKGSKLYIYVGQGNNALKGGYNGGGNGGTYGGNYNGIGGSGATDIRIVNGEWNDFESLKSRIMVAAGSGGYYQLEYIHPYSGGLVGYDARSGNQYDSYNGNGGKQTSGGAIAANYSGAAGLTAGNFGIGGNANRAQVAGFGGGRRWRILWRIWRKWSKYRWMGPEAVVHHLFQDIMAVMQFQKNL